jgi:hypothetical protein
VEDVINCDEESATDCGDLQSEEIKMLLFFGLTPSDMLQTGQFMV